MMMMVLLSGCGVSQEDYDKLKLENKQLKTELDEYKFGAERIIALVKKAYTEKNYSVAKQNIILLNEKHPESPNNKDFSKLLKTIKKEEKKEKKRKEILAEKQRKELAKKEKERIKLANLNNTGMWSVRFYVDEFGEPTKQGYITNTSLIKGAFSNTATQDSKLNIDFLISNSSNISIQLYEYAGNNPVKAYSTENYTVLMQDKKGKRFKLKAVNYSERLRFNKKASRKIHNALMKGGSVKFRITEDNTPTTQYKFKILKADWYENAYKKLKGSDLLK